MLGLDHDGVGAALDVDRPAMRLVRPFVGNNGVGAGRRSAALAVSASCRRADSIWPRTCCNSTSVLALLPAVGRFDAVELIERGLALQGLSSQPPPVVFEVAEFKPGFGQLRRRLFARASELLDAPLHVFPLLADFGSCEGLLLGQLRPRPPPRPEAGRSG